MSKFFMYEEGKMRVWNVYVICFPLPVRAFSIANFTTPGGEQTRPFDIPQDIFAGNEKATSTAPGQICYQQQRRRYECTIRVFIIPLLLFQCSAPSTCFSSADFAIGSLLFQSIQYLKVTQKTMPAITTTARVKVASVMPPKPPPLTRTAAFPCPTVLTVAFSPAVKAVARPGGTFNVNVVLLAVVMEDADDTPTDAEGQYSASSILSTISAHAVSIPLV